MLVQEEFITPATTFSTTSIANSFKNKLTITLIQLRPLLNSEFTTVSSLPTKRNPRKSTFLSRSMRLLTYPRHITDWKKTKILDSHIAAKLVKLSRRESSRKDHSQDLLSLKQRTSNYSNHSVISNLRVKFTNLQNRKQW